MTHFNNLEVAFSDKSNADLNRAHLLFKTISSPFLSKILTSMVKICLWLKLPITPIIKATVFKHFCGGTTIKNSQKVMDKLWESHIGTILDYSAEGKKSEEDFNHVMEETIRTILKSKNEKSIPFSVFKFTGLCSFSLLEKMSDNSVLTKKEEVEK
jgi:proline dehydrogenase